MPTVDYETKVKEEVQRIKDSRRLHQADESKFNKIIDELNAELLSVLHPPKKSQILKPPVLIIIMMNFRLPQKAGKT